MPTRARTRALAAKAAVQEDEDVEVEEMASGEGAFMIILCFRAHFSLTVV